MSASGQPAPWSGEEGAQRLFDLVRSACADAADLPTRLEAGLRVALDTLAADPELAHLLTAEPYLGDDEDALESQRRWIERFGALLRDAAAEDPRATTAPPFLAPFLIGGVRFQIARLAINREVADLPRLLPAILDALLAYYFDPGEPRTLARAGRR